MKCELKAWSDTGFVDLKLIPETDGEKALLILLRDRTPRHTVPQGSADYIEIVFERAKP